jgi:hypothetical protein
LNVDFLFKKVMVRSGQFLIDNNNIELDVDRFRVLVEDALSTYNRFYPHDQHVFIAVASTRHIILTDSLMHTLTGTDYLGVPDWVSDAMPSSIYGVHPSYLFTNWQPNYNPNLMNKTSMPWTYRKPNLYLPITAEWDIHCVWKHRIVEKETPQGYVYDIPTLDSVESDKFVRLLQGLFLQGIGRSRRAFTMGDLPIAMDGAEIASEGVEIEREAVEDLENIQKFYLAW